MAWDRSPGLSNCVCIVSPKGTGCGSHALSVAVRLDKHYCCSLATSFPSRCCCVAVERGSHGIQLGVDDNKGERSGAFARGETPIQTISEDKRGGEVCGISCEVRASSGVEHTGIRSTRDE